MSKFELRGATSLSHNRWINLKKAGISVWVKPAECTSSKSLKAALAANGIVVATTKEVEALLKSIENIDDFPREELAEQPGWNGDHY